MISLACQQLVYDECLCVCVSVCGSCLLLPAAWAGFADGKHHLRHSRRRRPRVSGRRVCVRSQRARASCRFCCSARTKHLRSTLHYARSSQRRAAAPAVPSSGGSAGRRRRSHNCRSPRWRCRRPQQQQHPQQQSQRCCRAGRRRQSREQRQCSGQTADRADGRRRTPARARPCSTRRRARCGRGAGGAAP